MKKLFQFLMMVSISLMLLSCDYDQLPEESNLPVNVSFQTDIQPIFDQNCISCHNGTIELDFRTGNSYNALMSLPEESIIPGDADDSELIEMLKQNGDTDNPMPPSGPMPIAKINLFISWINEGALNN